jgi:copper(I)-binding protein
MRYSFNHTVCALCFALGLAGAAQAEHNAAHVLQAAASKAVLAASAAVSGERPVQITDAWIRPAGKGQGGTGGYMRLTSPAGATLVGFATPVAATAELHEMSMEGSVMHMRALPSVELPAGKTVSFQPGGNHLMLMGLKKPLKVGDKVSLTLTFKGSDGKAFTQEVKVPVR